MTFFQPKIITITMLLILTLSGCLNKSEVESSETSTTHLSSNNLRSTAAKNTSSESSNNKLDDESSDDLDTTEKIQTSDQITSKNNEFNNNAVDSSLDITNNNLSINSNINIEINGDIETFQTGSSTEFNQETNNTNSEIGAIAEDEVVNTTDQEDSSTPITTPPGISFQDSSQEVTDSTSENHSINSPIDPLNTDDYIVPIVDPLDQLSNSSFESGDKSHWHGTEGIVTTKKVFSGNFALALAGNPNSYSLISQTIPVTGGRTYQFSGSLAVEGLTTGSYRFQVRWYNADGDQLGSVRKTFGITSTTAHYKWYGVELIAAEHAVTAKILLMAAKADGIGYFDDISILEISNVQPSNLWIEDNFDEDSSSNWVIFDDSPSESNWKIIDGAYVQSNERDVLRDRKNRRAALDGTFHIGTYAYLKSSESLSDYRVTLDITPIEEPGNSLTDDGYDIGFMFRYQDNDNYYRISLNTAYGYARFERKLSGVFSTLAVDGRGYDSEGTVIKIDIEVVGDLIQIFIDEEARFAAQDAGLQKGGIALYTQDGALFDNLLITDKTSTPSIVIDKPVAYSTETGNSVAISAVVINKPSLATVEFDASGITCNSATEFSPGYFTSVCTNLSQGEHIFTATLLENGIAVSSDNNSFIGVLGDVRIAIGDSLTNGYSDTFSHDNKSSDGKINAEQGYVGVLQSLLSISNPIPQMIFNEGVPGDDSADTIDLRINSILERYPNINVAQIMIGTNDAAGTLPVPSGLGCTGKECKGTYKENVQNLIDTLQSVGIKPVFALIPPAFNSETPLLSSRNELIQEYNTVIRDELVNHELGPDLFTYFLNDSQNRISMFIDSLHFNGLGYAIVGHLWEHYINNGSALPSRNQLPLVLESICVRTNSSSCQDPLTYKQDYMQIGNPLYIDTTHEVTSIPEILNMGIWIRAAVADSNNSRKDYLSFSVDRDIEIYIAYDSSATALPEWLNEFTDTNLEISTTNESASSLHLYKKVFTYGVDTNVDGVIELGGNMATDSVNSNTNYTVIIKTL